MLTEKEVQSSKGTRRQMLDSVSVKEKDSNNGVNISFEFSELTESSVQCSSRSYHSGADNARASLNHYLSNLFLPAGYPDSVSQDYLHEYVLLKKVLQAEPSRYQIWNAIQACCSSVAGLLASRAVLETMGVGNSSASATNAMLVTVAQDVFSRVTTIISAYYLGSKLFPEAKTFRILADVMNDLALTFDVLSPHLDEVMAWFTPYHFGIGFRVMALCISGSLRALCGIAAGGSKAALTLHFATSSANGSGDIGDLNAKDGSKETVLVLLGLLCGTAILPYITTVRSTYITLFVLLACHIAANYIAVRGIALHTLNRQRASIAWSSFRGDRFRTEGAACLTPRLIAVKERLFEHPARVRDGETGMITGYSKIASFSSLVQSFAGRLQTHTKPDVSFSLDAPIRKLLDIFAKEKYVLWCDRGETPNRPIEITIVLKEGHSPLHHLKAWVHACEIARINGNHGYQPRKGIDERLALIDQGYAAVSGTFETFLESMVSVGWKTDEGTIVTGSPSIIVVRSEITSTFK